MVEASAESDYDPVIEYYKQFVDTDEIKENLKLTHEERLEKLFRRLRETQSEDVSQ
jgi:hypothetical protein